MAAHEFKVGDKVRTTNKHAVGPSYAIGVGVVETIADNAVRVKFPTIAELVFYSDRAFDWIEKVGPIVNMRVVWAPSPKDNVLRGKITRVHKDGRFDVLWDNGTGTHEGAPFDPNIFGSGVVAEPTEAIGKGPDGIAAGSVTAERTFTLRINDDGAHDESVDTLAVALFAEQNADFIRTKTEGREDQFERCKVTAWRLAGLEVRKSYRERAAKLLKKGAK